MQETKVNPWVGKIPWRSKWQPTPVSLPGESLGQRSLAGYSPSGYKRVRHDWVINTHTRQVARHSVWFRRTGWRTCIWVSSSTYVPFAGGLLQFTHFKCFIHSVINITPLSACICHSPFTSLPSRVRFIVFINREWQALLFKKKKKKKKKPKHTSIHSIKWSSSVPLV